MSIPSITAIGRQSTERATPLTRPQRVRRLFIVIAVAAAGVMAIAILLGAQQPVTRDPYSPYNPDANGTRATAQVLQQQGINVQVVRTTAAALAQAEAGTTLLITLPGMLNAAQLQALSQVEANIVLVGQPADLSLLTDRITDDNGVSDGTIDAQCDDPDAQAAGTISRGGLGVVAADSSVTTCFSAGGSSLYARWTEGEQTWTYIGASDLLTNAHLATAGNAALVFRALGQTDDLIWYMPSIGDTFPDADLPPVNGISGPAIMYLIVLGVVLVLWRGRQLGPVVVEPLPVTVKATETTLGRGRLYRRAAAYGHAAAALRAGLISRVGPRLGVPRHARPEEVVDAFASASGRPTQAVAEVLYGAWPVSAAALENLTHALDTLETEVQRG